MLLLLKAAFIIGGIFALISSHVLFKSKQQIENVVDKVIERVVEEETSFDLSAMNQTMDSLVDAAEMQIVPQEQNK